MQTAVATQDLIKPVGSPLKHRISARVRTAIEAMVWQGLTRDEAAQHAGIKDNSLYIAMRKPDVRRFYLSELDVLRTSEKARNHHALVRIRDQDENKMATVAAVKVLEQIDETPATAGVHRSAPGVTIIINGNAPVQAIEHQPVTIDQDPA